MVQTILKHIGSSKFYPADSILYKTGQECQNLYYLESGAVEICVGRQCIKLTSGLLNYEPYIKQAHYVHDIRVCEPSQIRNIPLTSLTPEINNVLTSQAIELLDLLYQDKLHILDEKRLIKAEYFQDQIQHIIDQATRGQNQAALIYLHLNRVQFISQSLGGSATKKLEELIIDRLQRCARKSDLLCQIDREKFALIIPHLGHIDECAKIANRLIEVIEKPFMLEEQQCTIGVCMGISLFPDSGRSVVELIRQAESALLKAKEISGSSYFISRGELSHLPVERTKIESDFRQALEQGDVLNFYQPIFDLNQNKIVGVETLVRWQKNKDLIVTPGMFMDMSEQTGLVVAMSEQILDRACHDIMAWNKKYGINLKMAVNVSMRWLIDQSFIPTLHTILAASKINPSLITLELTEGVLLRDFETARASLHQIKKTGIKIALDDFGTGYSSLSFLNQFQIDAIKMDKSFLTNITKQEDDHPLIRAFIKFAQELGIEMIAEGVETIPQAQYLRTHGCHLVQGYLYGYPMIASDLEHSLTEVHSHPSLTPHVYH